MRKALVVVGVVVVVGLAWWMITRPPEPPGPVPPDSETEMTVDELRSLIERKNLAIARLENSELEAVRIEDCVVEFEELARDWPKEPVAVQNLAIARLLQVDDTKTPADRQDAIARARAAIDALLELSPDGEVPHVLSGRVALLEEDIDRAHQEFSEAARINPDNAATWYEFKEAWNEFGDDVPDPVRTGLQKSFELAPDNLWVLRSWWSVQLKVEDPGIMQTLDALRPVLAGYADRIRELNGFDLMQQLETARNQAAAGDWNNLRITMQIMWNMIYGDDAAHSDLNHITRHPLDFVVSDFSDQLYADAPPLAAPEHREPTLAFRHGEVPFDGFEPHGVRAGVMEDFDLDGRLEMCLLLDGSIVILRRNGAMPEWAPIVATEVPGDWRGMLLVDVDDDRKGLIAEAVENPESVPHCHRADLDVVLYGENGLQVLLNVRDEESGRRNLVETDAFGDAPLPMAVQCCLAFDVDIDGDLDLLASCDDGPLFLSNRGNASFHARDGSILGWPDGLVIHSAASVDLDRDLDLDVLFAATDGTIGMLENLRHGNLRWQSLPGEESANPDVSAIEVLESDGNMSWDILTGSPVSLALQQTRTPARGDVLIGAANRLDVASRELVVADFDNDSFDEALCWNEQQVTLVNCAMDGTPTLMKDADLNPPADTRIVDVDYGDVDSDGDLDVFVFTADSVHFFENVCDPLSDWIDVQLVAEQLDENQGVSSGRVNHVGLGSVIEIKAGAEYRARVVRRPRTHFGLDSLGAPQVMRVVWTNGIPQNLLEPDQNKVVCEVQRVVTSCPYLYAWNGEAHQFVTDLCWAAPLGLPSPQGGLVPHRDWEYVRIDGRLLAPQDGVYRLQVTEELWEAAYFDQVRLVAIDHPADVSVYSNEKVGPAEISQYGIHTVRQPLSPVAARDHRGRDVLAGVVAEDDVYLRLHEDRIAQGYTDPTYLELDLGDLQDPQRIILFLTGWLYPTDANLNTAIAENPDLPGPQPPSIQVLSASGEWIEAMPYMGFPGGKTKTVAVDISDIFPTDDYRLRIVTGMELFWDHIFFTVDESSAEFVERDLELVSADLHFRGVSGFTPHPNNGPDIYHYDRVTSPMFAPMGGAFTRFGDVKDLITTPDDLLLVMGCGDECTLEFAVPSDPLPEGWTRDFILHSIGWDKDANMNIVSGQTVEPMPYRNMESYPYPPDSFPGGPEYDEYLRTYQTRTFGDAYFLRALQQELATDPVPRLERNEFRSTFAADETSSPE